MAKSKPWDEKWKIIETLPGGGQCFNYKVSSTNPEDTAVYVLKVIKDDTKIERRTRFYREVHNYISLNSPYFPQVVDHNCTTNPMDEGKLYFVYSFIEGENLEEIINSKGRVQLKDAIRLIMLLVDAVKYSHENDIVHRDIKPDNIILTEGNINMPKLIDFGLSAGLDDKELPESGAHQLGNRFLYLPELKYASGNKRDKRTDITYIVGSLFFVLTGQAPAQCVDEQGRFPHQRIRLREIINETTDDQFALLLRIFDIGFQNQLNDRFQTLDHLIESLSKILLAGEKNEFDAEEFLKSSNQPDLVNIAEKLGLIMTAFRRLFIQIEAILNKKFIGIEVGCSGPSVLAHWNPICIQGNYYLTDRFNREIAKQYEFRVYPNGAELIMSLRIADEEHIIERFQSYDQVNEATAADTVLNIMIRDFAMHKKAVISKS